MPRRGNRSSRRGGRGRRAGATALSHVRYNVFGKVGASGVLNILANEVPGFEIGRSAQIKGAIMELTTSGGGNGNAMQLIARAPDAGASPPSRDVSRSMPKLVVNGFINRMSLRVPVYGFYDYQATDALFQVLGPSGGEFSINFTIAYTGPSLGAAAALIPLDKLSTRAFEKLSEKEFMERLIVEDGFVTYDNMLRTLHPGLFDAEDDQN